MKCPSCGAQILDDDKFCSYCGAQIEKKKEETVFNGTVFSDSTQYTSVSQKTTLAGVALVLSVIFPLIGLIMGIVASSKAETDDEKRISMVAIAIGIVSLMMHLVFWTIVLKSFSMIWY